MAPANGAAREEAALDALLSYRVEAEECILLSLTDPAAYLPALEGMVRRTRLASVAHPDERVAWELLIDRLKVASRRARQKLGLPLR